MKKELSNKGFSLVELIIVFAIMAVLVGLLAPQYFKYVTNSRVSTDIANAEELATAFGVGMANGKVTPGDYTGAENSTIGLSIDVDKWPDLKFDRASAWRVSVSSNGITTVDIECGGTYYPCYPEPKGSGGYYSAFHKK